MDATTLQSVWSDFLSAEDKTLKAKCESKLLEHYFDRLSVSPGIRFFLSLPRLCEIALRLQTLAHHHRYRRLRLALAGR